MFNFLESNKYTGAVRSHEIVESFCLSEDIISIS